MLLFDKYTRNILVEKMSDPFISVTLVFGRSTNEVCQYTDNIAVK